MNPRNKTVNRIADDDVLWTAGCSWDEIDSFLRDARRFAARELGVVAPKTCTTIFSYDLPDDHDYDVLLQGVETKAVVIARAKRNNLDAETRGSELRAEVSESLFNILRSAFEKHIDITFRGEMAFAHIKAPDVARATPVARILAEWPIEVARILLEGSRFEIRTRKVEDDDRGAHAPITFAPATKPIKISPASRHGASPRFIHENCPIGSTLCAQMCGTYKEEDGVIHFVIRDLIWVCYAN